jgi:hypothetical protein
MNNTTFIADHLTILDEDTLKLHLPEWWMEFQEYAEQNDPTNELYQNNEWRLRLYRKVLYEAEKLGFDVSGKFNLSCTRHNILKMGETFIIERIK